MLIFRWTKSFSLSPWNSSVNKPQYPAKAMKIKIIATGSSKWQRFIRRWGVSFLVGEDVLFDTFGDPSVLLRNMRKFHIDISKIKHIVLSHDDWDHISGLWHLPVDRKNITVYICPGFQQEIKDRMASFGGRVVETELFTEIKEGIFSSGQIEAVRAGRVIFEQALVAKSLKSLALITGCAHPGIIKIIDVVNGHFLKEEVRSIIGGLHLKGNSREMNLDIIEKLQGKGVRKIVPMHCTGKEAIEMIRQRFGNGFIWAREGDVNKIVIIDEGLCVGCGACVSLCPKKILFIDEKSGKCKVSDESKCDRLRGCEKVCPLEAIKII
jgi:7,8-dihydropterin-6-yl-methyl-4-(beta-D-ribofuranosyl)aminobenzene 5'-phosphate synthase